MENPILNVKNISIIRDSKCILKDISFSINKNESWAIIGKNGSGKSFLLKILSTSIYPSQGEIEIYGKNTVGTNIWDFREKIGLVSDELQREYNDSVSVKEIILSGFFSSIGVWQKVEDWQEKRAEEILEKLNIKHFGDRIYKTLSYGERKKALIGRALVFNPYLIILDEPCNGLDLASKRDFLETLENLVKCGTNIVFVTHHIEEIIPQVTNVILLKNGEIFKIGKKEEVMTEENLKNTLDINFKLVHKNKIYWPQLYI
jgi:iron complex transport system ATP-binding protein